VSGDAGQVNAATVVLDDEQHIEPTEKDGVDVEEVDRDNRLGLGGQELLQLEAARCGAGSIPAALRMSQMVDGAILCPRPVSSPQIRR
jgi:hypothetical protein